MLAVVEFNRSHADRLGKTSDNAAKGQRNVLYWAFL